MNKDILDLKFLSNPESEYYKFEIENTRIDQQIAASPYLLKCINLISSTVAIPYNFRNKLINTN